MGYEDLKIRDVSRLTGEWYPPIGALGGPPAHELYRDLVVYASLQLFQDARARPWVVLRDGAHRRAFPVPSLDLRRALDRFRMHRNTRPVPESDIDEFVRIVEARVSDPDVEIPTLRSPVSEGDHPRPEAPAGPLPSPLAAGPSTPAEAPAPLPAVLPTAGERPRLLHEVPATEDVPLLAAPWAINASVSGAHRLDPGGEENLGRYVHAFRRLLHDGSWMGSTRELCEITRDDPFTTYASLLRYRTELAANDILIAGVDDVNGYRWLAVDRGRVLQAPTSALPTTAALPAE